MPVVPTTAARLNFVFEVVTSQRPSKLQPAGAGHGAGLEGLARLQDSGADRHVRGVTRVLVKHFVL